MATTTIDRGDCATLIAQWVALWNGDLAIAEQIISPHNRVHAALFDGGDGSAAGGVGGMQALVTQLRSLIPDLTFDVQVGPVIDGDLVAIRWAAAGTYGGGMPGAAAAPGTPVSFHGADFLRVADSVIAEYWFNADTLSLMTQLQASVA